MFDVNKLYEMAEKGERIDIEALKDYINSFETVVIWGAGNLGTALGKALIAKQIKISCYWDIDYMNKMVCNGIDVVSPFLSKSQKEKTLVIIGIVNGTLSNRWQGKELDKNGFSNYIFGMQLYEAVGCDQEIGKPLEASKCINTSICNFNTCKRYMNILKNGNVNTGLEVQVLEIIVSSRCTLDCKYCGQQAGETKRRFPEKYKDYPFEIIKHSIDVVMDRLDVVGTFSVIGGEPFIHPQLGDIVEHCLSKKNVAIIAITTNGICNISDKTIKQIKNERVKVNFSNYTQELGENEKRLFDENVNKIKDAGIACNVATPIWETIADELRDNPDFSEEAVTKRRSICVFGPSIAGNYLYACPQIERMSRMEVHDVSQDVIDLSKEDEKLTERLRELLNMQYYSACKYMCTNAKENMQIPPGEQWDKNSLSE